MQIAAIPQTTTQSICAGKMLNVALLMTEQLAVERGHTARALIDICGSADEANVVMYTGAACPMAHTAGACCAAAKRTSISSCGG